MPLVPELKPLSAHYRRCSSALPLGDGRIFLSGGYDELNHRLDPAIYDAGRNELKRIRAPSFARQGNAARLGASSVAMAGDFLYEHTYDRANHGGDAARLRMVEVYSLPDDKWTTAEPCAGWPPFASTGIVSVGQDSVLLYGTIFPEDVDDPNCIAVYNVIKGAWKVSPEAPFITSHRGCTEVFILSDDEVLFNGAHLYRLSTNRWKKFPRPWFTLSDRRYHRAGHLLYCFGMSDSLDGGIQVLNLRTSKLHPAKMLKGALGHRVLGLEDGSMLVFGGSHDSTIIGDRDGKKGWLERVLHVGVGAKSVHEVGRLSREHAHTCVVPVGDNRAVLVGEGFTQSWLLSYDDRSLVIAERGPATISPISHSGWLDKWLSKCESPAEEQFLVAAVTEFQLEPSGAKLVGGCVLEMQKEIGRARADFLFNGRYVVEVDGREFHSGRDNANRDAARDAKLRQQGFRVLRIPAYRVFHAPEAAMADVRDAIG